MQAQLLHRFLLLDSGSFLLRRSQGTVPLLHSATLRRAFLSSAFKTQRVRIPRTAPLFCLPIVRRSSLHVSATLRAEKEPKVEPSKSQSLDDPKPTLYENIWTIPNFLTSSRIFATPVLGWAILQGNFPLATGLLAYAGISDWVDGYIARRYNMSSVMGTILDPAADKFLMTTLTVALSMEGMLPVPLAVIIIGRDVLLSISAFYWRYITLPAPKTFRRYWDFSIPSAEVKPTDISKINTALQLLLMGVTTVSPLVAFDVHVPLQSLQWIVAGTTIWSGLGYLFSNSAVRIVAKPDPKK